MKSVTIKELHERTGWHVRQSAKSPIQVTDHGKLVAVLTGPHRLPPKRRVRVILPEYAALRPGPLTDVQEALDEIRGDR